MKLPLLSIARTALFLLAILHQGAWAACTGSGSGTASFRPGGGKVNIPANAPVGTTVWSTTVTMGTIGNVNCTAGAHVLGSHVYTSADVTASPLAQVYRIDVPYLGVRIVEINGNSAVATPASSWAASPPGFTGPLSLVYQVSLVVIGPVTRDESSSIGNNLFRTSLRDAQSGAALGTFQMDMDSFGARVGGSVCTISTPSVVVDLGRHPSSAFAGIGSTTAARSFSIELRNCPAAIQYAIEPVTTIIGAAGNSVVTLNPGSTAQGIGVQLLNNAGNPMALWSPVQASTSGGSYTIPLQGRFYQTAPTVSPGSANAGMTFTITYQ